MGSIDSDEIEWTDLACPNCGSENVVVELKENGCFSFDHCLKCNYQRRQVDRILSVK